MTMRKPAEDFRTVTPCRTTACGRSACAWLSLFCTWTCAMSGSVPSSKVSVICATPVEVEGGGNVAQPVEAGHLALDHLGHGVGHGLGRGAGIGRADHHRGRRDRGILRYGQAQDRQDPERHDDDGDHPGEDLAVDEETSHCGSLPFSSRWRLRPSRPARAARPVPRAPPARPRPPSGSPQPPRGRPSRAPWSRSSGRRRTSRSRRGAPR